MEIKPSFSDDLDGAYISHHGILGMHWGIRRYQNPDGSLTPAGKKRYRNSLTVVNNAKTGVKALRNEVSKQYAISQNNYEDMRDHRQSLIDDGSHTEESFDRMYPNWKTGTDYDRKTAEYYKQQAAVIDSLNKKLNEIDVTKQSFRDTVKLVDDIFDRSTITAKQIDNEYKNSSEYKKYKEMIEESERISKQRRQAVYNKYKI